MSTVTGYEEAIEALRQLDISVRARIVRVAVKDVVAEAASEMRTAAPTRNQRRRGSDGRHEQRLRQRLGSLVKTYKDGTLHFAMAGERSYQRGRRHGHLVEHGHRMVVGGTVAALRKSRNRKTGEVGVRSYIPRAKDKSRKGRGVVVGRVPGRPFMGSVIDKYIGLAPEKLRAALEREVATEAARLANG